MTDHRSVIRCIDNRHNYQANLTYVNTDALRFNITVEIPHYFAHSHRGNKKYAHSSSLGKPTSRVERCGAKLEQTYESDKLSDTGKQYIRQKV